MINENYYNTSVLDNLIKNSRNDYNTHRAM